MKTNKLTKIPEAFKVAGDLRAPINGRTGFQPVFSAPVVHRQDACATFRMGDLRPTANKFSTNLFTSSSLPLLWGCPSICFRESQFLT